MAKGHASLMFCVLALAACAPKPLVITDSGEEFLLPASVNGTSANFAVDTGATMVVIPRNTLLTMGIGPQDGNGMVALSQMADGQVLPEPIVTVPEIDVGPCKLKNVQVIAADNGFDPLFGLDGLEQLHIELHGKKMAISCESGGQA